MTELKPCPFCGGTNLKIKGGIGKYVSCLDCDNGAHFPGEGSTANENDAIEAWNTRAERTCKIVRYETGEPAEYDCDEVLWHCESCHEEVAIYAYNEDGDSWADKPAFCPNCGAKVVE